MRESSAIVQSGHSPNRKQLKPGSKGANRIYPAKKTRKHVCTHTHTHTHAHTHYSSSLRQVLGIISLLEVEFKLLLFMKSFLLPCPMLDLKQVLLLEKSCYFELIHYSGT